MASWPGKEADTPLLRADGKTEYTIRTTMPCGQKLKNTSARENPRSAYVQGHAALDSSVRRHLDTCKKCPPDTRRP